MLNVNVVKIRGKMAEKGITKQELSRRIGVTPNTVYNYFRNPGSIPAKMIDRMAKTLCDDKDEATAIFFE